VIDRDAGEAHDREALQGIQVGWLIRADVNGNAECRILNAE
jgi:hypothetical protein